MKVKLFIGAHCPHCPVAENILTRVAKDLGVEVEIIDTSLPTGFNEAAELGVKALPAFVINGNLYTSMSENGLRRLLQEVK